MNNKYSLTSLYTCVIGMMLLICVSGCKKNLPYDQDSLSTDTRFTQTVYTPVLGRNTLFSDNFFAGNSSQPLTFKIVNMRTRFGLAAPELTETFPVKVWTKAYTGEEKSIEEIEAKRKEENHPLFEVREHSGQFLMYSKATSNFIKTQPDSGYVFDVEVSNSGGRKYFRDLKLMPFKERAFEPSVVDPITGLTQYVGISPSATINMRGEKTNRYLGGSYDIGVIFEKMPGNGNSLTFKFVDSLYNPINPNKFNLTNWSKLVHGFNMVKTDDSVKYDVAYPIPLTSLRTPYTNSSGDKARVSFSYDRQGFGNVREVAYLFLDFAIFEKGNWKITFWFRRESPKFVND